MKLSITSTVDTNVGLQVTGMVGTLSANTVSLLTNGTVFCALQFYANDSASNLNKNTLYPVVLNSDDTIEKIVTTCTITLTGPEVEGANLPATIYAKVAAKLSADYGWTVVVA